MNLPRSTLIALLATLGVTAVLLCAAPAPASAGIIPGRLCNLAGGLVGKTCDALANPKKLLDIGKNLVTGHIGSAIKDYLGNGAASSASTALGLAAIVAWVYTGARAAFHDMTQVVGETATPQLTSVWFSSTYWRMAAMAALLTLPFLFAAAVQALLRSELALLARAAFGYLPLAMLAVGIAAPVAMLLLTATDELCSLAWSPSATSGLTSLLKHAGLAGLVGFIGSPFLTFLLCLFAAAGAVLVWLELAMREAAVYIVVLMLPLAFAALVWPARRVWAVRAVELLVALILSKFAIVAVLGLGGTALSHAGGHGLGAILAGMVLVLLAALAPWAVLRLVPLSELASGAAGTLRGHSLSTLREAWQLSHEIHGRASAVAQMARPSADPAVMLTDRTHVKAPRVDESESDASSPNGDELDEMAIGALGAHEQAQAGQGMQQGAGTAARQGGAARGFAKEGLVPEDIAARATETGAANDGERVPGAGAMWQAPDLSWRPLTLGPDDGWPPPPLWPAGQEGGGAPGVGDTAGAPDTSPGRPEAGSRTPDPDPNAAPQPPAAGPRSGGARDQTDPRPTPPQDGGPL